ncbi:MAG: Na+/H+ antiporter NhaA, partial [Acidimicrobiia bacterium]
MTGRRTHIRIPVAGRYITPLGQEYASVEALSGIVLLLATVVALTWANSPWSDSYTSFWGYDVTATLGRFSIADDLGHWVNDGLMAIFFFVVGLEVKRELTEGELTDRRAASLPLLAAVGGMVVPALVFFAWNPSGSGSSGWGIPMATDTAFALGVLALLGARVSSGLKLFLLTLAVVDDIGAICVIAVFYSSHVQVEWLGGAAVTIACIVLLQRLGVRFALAYVAPALVLWLCVFQSGVHATIAGVALGLLTPVADALRLAAWLLHPAGGNVPLDNLLLLLSPRPPLTPSVPGVDLAGLQRRGNLEEATHDLILLAPKEVAERAGAGGGRLYFSFAG